MHQAWHNLMCALRQHQLGGSPGCAKMWVGSGQAPERQSLILGNGTGLARHARARVLRPGECIKQVKLALAWGPLGPSRCAAACQQPASLLACAAN